MRRGVGLASAHPQGPVCMTLPREVSAETAPGMGHVDRVASLVVPYAPAPDPESVQVLADQLTIARYPRS